MKTDRELLLEAVEVIENLLANALPGAVGGLVLDPGAYASADKFILDNAELTVERHNPKPALKLVKTENE